MSAEIKYARVKVLRYDPQADETPRPQTFSVPVTGEKMNLLQALETIYQEQDDTLAFRRYCCGIQYCNSCLMLINGKQAHACLTIVNPGDEFEVAPVRGKRVLRDLVVEDT